MFRNTFFFVFLFVFALFSCNGQDTRVINNAVPCEDQLDSCKKENEKLKVEKNNYKKQYETLKADSNKEANSAKKPDFNAEQLLKYSTNVAWRLSFKGKSYDIYVVDTEANRIKFYLEDAKGKNLTFTAIQEKLKSQHSRLAFAMNGGMYHPTHKPVGLYIENGKQISKINTAKTEDAGNFYMQPNGIFGMNKQNKVFVVATDDYKASPDILWATQSGPMLLNKGEINSKFKEASPNGNIRNGVGVIDSTKVVFAISNEKVNFYEFAEFFKVFFGCKQALYLDGVISQMYLPELKRTQQKGENLGPIITVIR